MTFHRLTVPSYFGGLPGGYDYANNAVSGTPALIGPPRVSGPNTGTYLIGFGEDAVSKNVNRGLAAALENTDLLDNIVHRNLAIPNMMSATAGGGGDASIIVAGPAWVGAGGTPNTVDGIRTFVMLTDDTDNEIFVTGSECKITAIAGATPGDEWSTGNITLTVSPPVPAAQAYRVYFYTRGNLTTITQDALTKFRRAFAYNGGDSWADGTANPATTVTGQLDKILSDLSAVTGSLKIGGDAVSGSPYDLAAEPVGTQLVDIIGQLNTEHVALVAAIAAAVAYTDALRADINRVRFVTTVATINTPSLDGTIILNPGAAFALTLPDPATAAGQKILLINGDGTMSPTNKVTLTRHAAEKINGLAANFLLVAPYGRWILSCDGVDWNLI